MSVAIISRNSPTWKYNQWKAESHRQHKANLNCIAGQRRTKVQQYIPGKWFHRKCHVSEKSNQNVDEGTDICGSLHIFVNFIQ